MKNLPIRVRLTIWYLVVFSLALVAFGVATWTLVRERLYAEVAHDLHEHVMAVEHYMSAQHAGITAAGMRQELLEEYDAENQGTWLQIRDERGDWTYRSQSMAAAFASAPLPQAADPKGKIWKGQVGHLRLAVIEQPIVVQEHRYTVQTAVVTNGVHHTLDSLRRTFLLLAPIFVLIAAIGSYYMSRRALSTVDQITNLARSIHDRNLDSRLPALHTNDELQRLSDTLNEMLSRIEASFKRTRQFTADASHELRTPLSLIRTEAELALRKSRSEEEYRAALTHIHSESVRTTELIESLLTLARTDSGAEVLQLRPLLLVEFLRKVAEEWTPMFASSQLAFATAFPTSDAAVYADESTLRRLMILLLDNARKYTPEGGRVTLRLELAPGSATVSVEDSGIGIDEQHLPRIFDRFYRVDKARSRSQGGAGLGLSLAKWIATQHRTTINVVSVPGEGSKFTFRLETVSKQSRPMSSERPESQTERVM